MVSKEEKKILTDVNPWEMYELDRYLSQEIWFIPTKKLPIPFRRGC